MKKIFLTLIIFLICLSPAQATEIDGYSGGTAYATESTLTRGAAAQLLMDAFELEYNSEMTISFTDVPETSPYYEAVCVCYHRGLLDGYPDGLFRPNNSVTRGTLAFLLYKCGLPSGYPDTIPSDVSSTSYAYNAICSVLALEIMSVDENGKFNPSRPAYRSEVAFANIPDGDSTAFPAGATKGFVAAYDMNGKMLNVTMVDPTASSSSPGFNEDIMTTATFYVNDAFVPVVEKSTIIVNENLAAYNEFRNLFTVTLREATDNNELLFDAVYSGQKTQAEFWNQWSQCLVDADKLEQLAEQLAAEVSSKYPGYTSALYFKYQTTSLGYSFAYPGDRYATSFVPNPFNIHDVDTSVDIEISPDAQVLFDMFSIKYKRATTSNELLYDASYSGALSEDEFIAMWNKRIEEDEVVAYAKEIATALQNKNPKYIVSLTFKYGTSRLGYVFRYIGHDIASFNTLGES